jgi:hypothetical protein
MAKYLFSLKSTKYGAPTGLNTMPDAGSMTALPDTVKGSVSLNESDPQVSKFRTDQKKAPIRVVKTEDGEFSVTMQFYDMTYDVLEAIKGGTSVAAVPATSPAAWQNGASFEDIEKALELELDSGQKILMYNAYIETKINGSGSRDGMIAVEMKATAQLAADLSGDYEIKDVDIPA